MLAEFDHFRFIRDCQGSLAELPSERESERTFLVLDCLRYRIGLLHVFEGLGGAGSEQAERFDREMAMIRSMSHPDLTPILGHGCDDTELYCAEAITGGELLGGYLRRVGPLPEIQAIDLALDLLAILTSCRDLPRSLENFDLGRFYVSPRGPLDSGLRLHFADYGGWLLPPASGPAEVVSRVGLGLYSLLSGFEFRFPPHTLFDREARLTSGVLRDLVRSVLKGDPERPRFRSLDSFATALRAARESLPEAAQPLSDLPPVRCLLRDWLLAGHDTIDPGSEYRVAGPAIPSEFSHAFDASAIRGGALGRLRFQLFPGLEGIPHDAWLGQHQSAMRRIGRFLPNQLAITALEDWGRCLLVGEERVDGVTIASLLRSHGALPLDHVLEIVGKINAALEVIERTAGAAPVWRLGSRDVFLVSGGAPIGALVESAYRDGASVWRRLPVRLRLHQTAADLIEGIGLPEATMRRLREGGKADEHGRRAAVLLPLICEMLTGIPFSWDAPVISLPTTPDEIAALIEETRLRLIEDPKTLRSGLLEDIRRAFGLDDSRPPRDTATISGEAPVCAPAPLPDGPLIVSADAPAGSPSTTATLSPEPPADAPLSLTLRPFGRHRKYEYQTARAVGRRTTTECEFLGVVDDGAFIGATGISEPAPANVAELASPRTGTPDLVADDSAHSPRPVAAQPPTEPTARRGFRRLLLPLARALASGQPPAECGDSARPVATPAISDEAVEVTAEPVAISDAPAISDEPVTTADGTIINDEPIAAADPEPASHADSDPDESRVVGGDLPLLVPADYSTPAAVEPEPLSFFSFLKSESSGVGPESPTPAPEEDATPGAGATAVAGLPSVGSMLKVFSLREGLGLPPSDATDTNYATRGEQMPPASPAPDRNRFLVRYGRIAGLSVAAGAALWGITYGLVTIAGSVERETLAESLEPVIQTDYLKLASREPSDLPPAPNGKPAPETDAPLLKLPQIGKADDAIRLGNEARAADRNSDAVNLYLRALEIEPSSTEARTQLWVTLETWSTARNAPSATEETAEGLERAAEQTPRAAWLLADYHLRRDRALGLLWLRRSAEAGHARHQRILGLALSEVPETLPEAMGWLRRAAESGDTETQLLYGIALQLGRGVPVDLVKGADWIEKAARAGNGQALDSLGVCLARGVGRPVDHARALELFQQACDAGNPLAQYNLATRFAKGLGTPRDKIRAARLYRVGADHGDPHCMHALGRCLEAGFGVPRDLDTAVSWMRRAASLGHHEALAWCLRQGIAMDVAKL